MVRFLKNVNKTSNILKQLNFAGEYIKEKQVYFFLSGSKFDCKKIKCLE